MEEGGKVSLMDRRGTKKADINAWGYMYNSLEQFCQI